MALEEHFNECFRKIGRNIYLFQKLEHMLKYIISGSSSGFLHEIVEHREKTQSKTLGQLIGLYFEKSKSSNSENLITDERFMQAPHFSISLSFFNDHSYIESKKAELENLVIDRNKLVHHLLPQFDIDSIDSCIVLDKQLDRQRENIIEAINHLKPICQLLIESQKVWLEFITSGELERHLKKESLKNHPAIQLLCDVSEESELTNGWLTLNAAGRIVIEHGAEKLSSVKAESGQASLKQIMIATELFEFREEETSKGHRLLFRLKPI